MSRNKYGGNSIGKDTPEMEEVFGNTAILEPTKAPCPPTLRKWMEYIQEYKADQFRKENGLMEDWRPRGTGDPAAPPPHWNKKDHK